MGVVEHAEHGVVLDAVHVGDPQFEVGQGQPGGGRVVFRRVDDEQGIAVPQGGKFAHREGDVAGRGIGQEHQAVADAAEHDEVLEAGVIDRHDGRHVQRLQVAHLGLEAGAVDADRGDIALHVEQRKAAPLDDLVLLALGHHAFHRGLLRHLQAEVEIEQGHQRGRAAAVVISLAHDVAVLELREGLDLHALLAWAAAHHGLGQFELVRGTVLRFVLGPDA